MLLEAQRRAESDGRRFVVKSPSAVVRRLIEISGLTDYIQVDLNEGP
jgi:anti-anti-sigma regulatory factor